VSTLILSVVLSAVALAQDVPPPPRPAGTKPPVAAVTVKSRVDEVIAAVKASVPDEEIIASLREANKPIELSLSDKTKLKSAGVSAEVMRAMQNPAAAAPPPPPAAPAPNQPPAPPPPAADNGPSLESTMKFIEDKLGSIGPVNYIGYFHDNTAGSDWTNKFSAEATNVRADAAACRVGFHVKLTKDGAVVFDSDAGFRLKTVQEVAVETMEQFAKKERPEFAYRVDPPAFMLEVRRDDHGGNDFFLYDEALANRIAKALVHAVELCGGGSKPEPF